MAQVILGDEFVADENFFNTVFQGCHRTPHIKVVQEAPEQEALTAFGIVFINRLLYFARRADEDLNGTSGDQFNILHGMEIERIGHRQREAFADLVNGDKTKFATETRRDRINYLRIDLIVRQRQIRKAVLTRQRLGYVLFRREFHLNEDLAQQTPVFVLIVTGKVQLLMIDHFLFDQEFAQLLGGYFLEIFHI